MKPPRQLDMLTPPPLPAKAKEPATIYKLTLRCLPDALDQEVRLRRLLKIALRRFGFRCTAVDERPAVATCGKAKKSFAAGKAKPVSARCHNPV
jgi:hypothetical protein